MSQKFPSYKILEIFFVEIFPFPVKITYTIIIEKCIDIIVFLVGRVTITNDVTEMECCFVPMSALSSLVGGDRFHSSSLQSAKHTSEYRYSASKSDKPA